MVRSTSVHSQKRELKVNDKVLVKKDFDNNKSTRKDFFGVEFEPKGIVVGFSKNGLVQVKLDHDNEIKRFKINMLKLDEQNFHFVSISKEFFTFNLRSSRDFTGEFSVFFSHSRICFNMENYAPSFQVTAIKINPLWRKYVCNKLVELQLLFIQKKPVKPNFCAMQNLSLKTPGFYPVKSNSN